MRRGGGGGHRVGGDVVDGFLAVLHACHVVGQRHRGRRFGRGGKAQQAGDAVAVGVILDHAFLEHPPEQAPEAGVLFGVLARHVLQQAQNAPRAAGADAVHHLAALQDLARHVQRQVVGVDHAAHEAQIGRQQMRRVVHDEHALHIQAHAVAAVAVPQVERLGGRHEQQGGVFVAALDAAVQLRQRRLHVVAELLVEGVVFVLRDVRARPRPQGGGLVDGVPGGRGVGVCHLGFALFGGGLGGRHAHREGDVVGVGADDGFQAPGVGELVRVVAQVQHDFGPARRTDGLDAVLALAGRLPAHALRVRPAGAAGGQRDAVGDDEGGVETDAELADQARILRLAGGLASLQRLQELGSAGMGDGADVGDDFLTAHADAVVAHGDGVRLRIALDFDAQLAAAVHQRGVAVALEAQLVERVGGVGDQLAQENLAVAVQAVDHQLEQLTGFGGEAEGFGLGHGGLVRKGQRSGHVRGERDDRPAQPGSYGFPTAKLRRSLNWGNQRTMQGLHHTGQCHGAQRRRACQAPAGLPYWRGPG
ncbi:MAG: hypothetical protein OZX49_00122 [Immundisolibacter sp.]|nr:hypothetical protein [Immundisolibacter sp.]